MKRDPRGAEMLTLLDSAAPATLTIHRADGELITSPVWFRLDGDEIEVVVAASDRKLEHLRHDARCLLLIFETKRPFRGIELRTRAKIVPDEDARSRLAIASRYLGSAAGRAYADVARRPPGFVLRLPLSAARGWDLADNVD